LQSREDLAHAYLIDLVRRNTGSLDSLFASRQCQFSGLNRPQTAAQGAYGCSARTDKNDVFKLHDPFSF
jgi:hypothetical protein